MHFSSFSLNMDKKRSAEVIQLLSFGSSDDIVIMRDQEQDHKVSAKGRGKHAT